jgi:hypothetical protein
MQGTEVRSYSFQQPEQLVEVPEGTWHVELIFVGNLPEKIKCPECDGRGRWRLTGWGAMGDDSDERTCDKCYGSGDKPNPAFVMPAPPPILVEAIRKLVRDEWNKAQNTKFRLEP